MTKNPFINAAAASGYIVFIVFVLNYLTQHVRAVERELIVPIMMLSLFTLSAAIMGYLFLSQPLRMYLDGHKQAGVTLFLQTVGVFAVITICILLLLLSGSLA